MSLRDDIVDIIDHSQPSCGLPKECYTECGKCGMERIMSRLIEHIMELKLPELDPHLHDAYDYGRGQESARQAIIKALETE